MEHHQILNFRHTLLQVLQMVTHIPQIGVDHEISRQPKDDITCGCAPRSPLGNDQAHNPGDKSNGGNILNDEKVFHHRPSTHSLASPKINEGQEPRIFAVLRAETLHNRVAGDGVSNLSTDFTVGIHVGPVSVRQMSNGKPSCHGNIKNAGYPRKEAHQWPAPAQHRQNADEHERCWKQRCINCVCNGVVGPHATGQLPDGGTRMGAFVPIGGIALHASEAFGDNVAHYLGSKMHPEPELQALRCEEHHALTNKQDPGPYRRVNLIR